MIIKEKQELDIKRETILRFLADIGQQDGLLIEFDEELWHSSVQSIYNKHLHRYNCHF